MRKLHSIVRDIHPHWVGDGFPVRTLFTYQSHNDAVSPFLLLDYAAPHEFPPAAERRGVGEHPHRGFETVTIVYQGEIEHRDSAGNNGTIGPGDVQWMTAASGVVHEEFHGPEFTREGGMFEVAQIWVNLPADVKMSAPRYQEILDAQIPLVSLGTDAGTARVIAGELDDTLGPAETFTPVHIWDLKLNPAGAIELTVPDGHTAILLVRDGSVTPRDAESVGTGELALFERAGDRVALESPDGATALFLAGEPINEPVVGRGPFVMNTEEEIDQAIADYRNGRMGRL